jgi:uncharacterized BrkB/YihY/UPF0761 family membrane protein
VTDTDPVEAVEPDAQPKKKGRIKQMLMPMAMRYALLRRGIGIQVVFRSTGGGLIVGGLAYAALFALIPTIILIIAGIFLLIDDPQFRQEAIELINSAFPAFTGFTDSAIEGARSVAAAGGVIAIIGFAWGASGLYLNLTRAMERFFPGTRVSGALARVLGVLLVVLVIVGVVAAVFVAGILTVFAQALELDAEWLISVIGAIVTLALATGLVYGIYRVMPANPPSSHSARVPAILVGIAIALMTLLYSVISPWLVSGFQMFGVMASFFVALVWLRLVFLTMVYGAAMARYRDFVLAAREIGETDPDRYATEYAVAQEAERAARELAGVREIERRKDQVADAATASDEVLEAEPGEPGSGEAG